MPGRLKEAVDVLEMALRREGDMGSVMIERAIAGLGDTLDEIRALALSGFGERVRDKVEKAGYESSIGEETEAILKACVRQCDRASALLSEGTGRVDGDSIKALDKRVYGLRRLEDTVELSRRLKEARMELGLSQAAAAERMEISPAYLSRMENLSCNPPSARTRRRIEYFLAEAACRRDARHGSGSRSGAAPVGAPVSPGGAPLRGDDHTAPMEKSDAGACAEDAWETTGSAGGVWEVEGETRIGDSEEGKHEITVAGTRGRRAALLRELLTHSLRLGEEDLGLLAEVARSLWEKGNTPF